MYKDSANSAEAETTAENTLNSRLFLPTPQKEPSNFDQWISRYKYPPPLANLHLLPTSTSCQPPPLANLHLFLISIASQPSRPNARTNARERCQPFLHYVGRFPIFPNLFYSATASTLVTNRI